MDQGGPLFMVYQVSSVLCHTSTLGRPNQSSNIPSIAVSTIFSFGVRNCGTLTTIQFNVQRSTCQVLCVWTAARVLPGRVRYWVYSLPKVSTEHNVAFLSVVTTK